jgi:cellulose synthase/poly-beta-1,6-N-acetylglucosamine synthase-like glycosyltransferase
MISVIITSFKEPKTIGKCIKCIADRKYSGIPKDFEIIQVSPDRETLEAGRKMANRLNLSPKEYRQIVDPKKGKPYALKMALNAVKGDIVILTDGDTYFGKNAVKELLRPFEDMDIGGVSGRPVSRDERDNQMGYYGHLLADSGHHRRSTVLEKVESKKYYISNDNFFPMSGYIMAIRNIKFDIPEDVLSDDAYISYMLRNSGYEIAYTPKARCYVKFPTTLKDYYKQKVRSIGGYVQLERYGIFQKDKQSRSFLIELNYFFYVFKYSETFREFIWSFLLFPIRLWTWIRIFWERTILKKGMPKGGWERIESTK